MRLSKQICSFGIPIWSITSGEKILFALWQRVLEILIRDNENKDSKTLAKSGAEFLCDIQWLNYANFERSTLQQLRDNMQKHLIHIHLQ